MPKAIFEVVTVINDAAIQAAIAKAVAGLATLDSAASKVGGPAAEAARANIVQSAAALDITRQQAVAAGIGGKTLEDLDALRGLLRESYTKLARAGLSEAEASEEFTRAKRKQIASIQQQTADAKNAKIPGDEQSLRDKTLEAERRRAEVADLKATDPEIGVFGTAAAASSVATRARIANELADDERVLHAQHVQQAAANRQKLAMVRRTLAGENNLLAAQAQLIVDTKRLQLAERALAKEALQAAVATGQLGRGSFLQRLQANVANRQGGPLRAPTEFANARQLATGSLITTGRFALSGALLYGGIQGISTAIKEAQELEKILNQIRRQFESLGQADQFEVFADSMLRIARETGAAASEVAFVGFQLQGAFGGDTARSIRETEAAFQAVRVTGLSITEVIDAFTALTQNFDAAGVSIQDVSDTALGLQERFGVLAKETISFAADLAPVAAQAGFTVQQLEALGAVGQKYSGRSGSSLAEAFGRILPAIQGNAVQFFQLFEQLGDTNLSNQVAEAFSTGNIAEFFNILLRSYDDLSGAQKNYVIELLGGRREAQALIPILENSAELVHELERSESDAGKTAQYFGDLQKTLNQQLAEFGEELSQLAIKIFNSGIGDFFEDIIRLGSGAIDILNTLLGVVDALGGALGTIPGASGGLTTLIEGILLYKGIGLIGGALRSRLGGAAATAAAGSLGGRVVIPGGVGAGGVANLAGTAAATTIASRYAAGAAGKAGVSAFAGGLRGAFAGFGWVGLGLTIGSLAISQISSGVQQKARERINEIAGGDARFSNPELEELGNEFNAPGAASAEDLDLRKLIEEYNDLGRSVFDEAEGRIKTLAELRKAMKSAAEADASGYQQALDALPGDLSQDSEENREAASALLDEHKARLNEFFTSIVEDEEVLTELAREQLKGGPNEGDEAALGKRVGEIRDNLNKLIGEIENETADPANVQAVVDVMTRLVPSARRAINARLAAEQNEIEEEALALLTAQEAIQGYESGEVGLAQARAAIRQAISSMQSLGYATGSAENRKELADLIKREKEFQSEILLREAEAIVEGTEGFNTNTPQENLATITNLLRSGRLTPADQRKATSLALNALKAVHQARLDAADTAAEEAKILAEGTPVPEALQTELVYQYLAQASVAWQDFISIASNGVVEVGAAITRTAAEIYAKGGVTFTQAVRSAILLQINTLKQLRARMIEGIERAAAVAGIGLSSLDSFNNAVASMDAQIASLEGSLNNVPDVDVPDYDSYGADAEGAAEKRKAAAEEAKREYEEAQRKAHEIRLAQIDVLKAQIEGDPVAEADLDARIARENAAFARATGDRAAELSAQAALIRAQRARQEAVSDIAAARDELSQARRGDDPVGNAYAELLAANRALALARGAAARYRAMAQQVRARRALQEAFQDIGIAQLELAQAMADAAGDSVLAARKALEIARQQLANIRKNSPKDQAAILRAQADVVSAEAALRDADLQERQRAIDVALQLEQITVGQAIAQLQALLTIPKLTKEQTDAILLKIKSLKDELEGDFRFNLPTQFTLPTAYEVARLSQTADGGGYNDNRVITVTVNAETNASPEDIASAVEGVVGQPNRSGTLPRRY